MKKKLLIILGTLAIIFLILFAIQIIDEKVNGDDYKKINTYTNEIGSYIKKSYCYQDIINVLNRHQEDNLSKNQDIINRNIQSCQELQEKIADTPIPELKLKQKKETIELFKHDLINIAELGKNYYHSYFDDADVKDIDLIIAKANNLTKKSSIHLIELMITYSIKDIIIIKPLLLYTKLQIIL